MMFHNNFVVAVISNGKICREIDSAVILPFGSEYSIRLRNKESRKALVSVYVDNRDATEYGKLIIPPDGYVDLEGFMDAKNGILGKFRFIEKTKQISDHRGDSIDDGLITVKYRFEKPVVEVPIQVEVPWYHKPPLKKYEPYAPPGWPNHDIICSSEPTFDTTAKMKFSSCTQALDGITVPGSDSNQTFKTGSIGLMKDTEYTIVLQIKGTKNEQQVEKPLLIKDHEICPTCGSKNKSLHKFCFSCGTRLI